jgi:hypothetical protein
VRRVPAVALMVATAATLALAIPALAARTRTVTIASTITLAKQVSTGKVSSANAACVTERKVVVKYRDARGKLGAYGRDVTDESGKYFIGGISPVKGEPPYEFFAVAKARTIAGKGTTVVCSGATSKARVVTGG